MNGKDQKTYCLCGQVYDENRFMILCDNCKDWFHGSCVNLPEYKSIEIDRYHCPVCVQIVGESILKVVTNNHRQDPWDPDAESKPLQVASSAFIETLKKYPFSEDANSLPVHLLKNGYELTEDFLTKSNFWKPIVVNNIHGLGMTIPTKEFNINDVLSIVGSNFVLDVIDVHRQIDAKMTLADFAHYFISDNRDRIFNVISFEFSETALSNFVKVPKIVNNLDWATTYWKKNHAKVRKYCLMSAQNSYTDFHIDFGGTSVWYHVLSGQKVFLLVPPTDDNLRLYEIWMSSKQQSETFFATLVDKCYRWTLNEGQTMFIPSGWIHAVYTPIDSLVFGGNFLHNFSIPMQLKVYELEKRLKTFEKFKYPGFEIIHWYAAKKLLSHLKHQNHSYVICSDYLIESLRSLYESLKYWSDESNPRFKECIASVPQEINHQKLLKNFHKELKRQYFIKESYSEYHGKTDPIQISNDEKNSTEMDVNSSSLIKNTYNSGDINTNVNDQINGEGNGNDNDYDEDDDEFNLCIDEDECHSGTEPLTVQTAGSLKIKIKGPLLKESDDKGYLSELPSSSCSSRKQNKTIFKDNYLDDHLLHNVQDDDYIYPSLDASDDDENQKLKKSRLSEVDESWNPKSYVDPLLPKRDRSSRQSAKRSSVGRILEATAAKRSNFSDIEQPEIEKKIYNSSKRKPNKSTKKQSKISKPVPTTSSAITHVNEKVKRRKKLQTVKQRLGKILKIHKTV